MKQAELRQISSTDYKYEFQMLNDKILDFNIKRSRNLPKLEKRITKIKQLFSELNLFRLKVFKTDSKIESFEYEIQQASDGIYQMQLEKEVAKTQYDQAKVQAKDANDRYKSAKKNAITETVELFDSEPQENIQELHTIIASLEAQKNALAEVDPYLLKEYEERVEQINQLTVVFDELSAEHDKASDEIQELHLSWKARLDSITEKISESFSESFSSIGCAGSVLIRSDPDYSKWGIEIHVKFRDSETLQLLTGSRQSGGERSVSTMLYLISLQSLSASPFRVVDEINQGMDPRNERLVHKLIVKAACSDEQTSQYFLITPKLLPDLEYHERLKVLCIFNGTWQPNDLDIKQEIAFQKRIKV
jgi:chromosome segregation ATPase